jgi:hypothetical protein
MKCNANKAPEGRNVNRKTSALPIKPQRGDILIVRAYFKWGHGFIYARASYPTACINVILVGSINMSPLRGFRALVSIIFY